MARSKHHAALSKDPFKGLSPRVDDDFDQLGFDDLLAADRSADIQDAHAAAAAAADPIDASARRELELLQSELIRFIRSVGVRGEFQSADFIRSIYHTGVNIASLDLRAMGGLIIQLRKARIIAPTGEHRHTGRYGNSKSATRPVFRILKLDFSELGWPETLPSMRAGGAA